MSNTKKLCKPQFLTLTLYRCCQKNMHKIEGVFIKSIKKVGRYGQALLKVNVLKNRDVKPKLDDPLNFCLSIV